MKTFAYIYSRTWDRDFHVLTKCDVLPDEIRLVFDAQIKALLNDSVSPDSYNQPTWLLSRKRKYLLWGFSITNNLLSDEFTNDKFGRSIPCFCGVIYVDFTDSLQLPYSIEPFKPMFNKVMNSVWKPGSGSAANIEVSLGQTNLIISASNYGEVNTKDYLCRLFPSNINDKELLSQCLSVPKDVSIAINVLKRNQVCDNKEGNIPLMNAVMRSDMVKHEDVLVKHQCSKCGKWERVLMDGMCDFCFKEEQEKREDIKETKHMFICRKCENAVDAVDDKGICHECRVKRKKRILYWYISIGLLLLLAMGIKTIKPSTPIIRGKDNQMNNVDAQKSVIENRMTKHIQCQILLEEDTTYKSKK